MYNWISKVKGEIVVGGDSQLFGNYNCDCEGGASCFGCIGYWFHNFYNKPMGTDVTVSIQYCYDHQWIEVPLQFVYVGNDQYDLYGMNPIGGFQWESMGYVKFIEQTPPDCPNADGNFCDDLFYIENPEFEILEHTSAYTSHEKLCDEPTDVAYTWLVNTPAAKVSNLYSFTNDSLMVCFNRNLQRWKFQLNPEKINLNIVIDLCYSKIIDRGWVIVDDTSDLNEIVSNGDCELALQSFEGHKYYGYKIPDKGYLLKEVVMLHEGIHKMNYDKYVQDYKYFFYNTMYALQDYPCSYFSNPTQAKDFGKIFYETGFADFWDKLDEQYDMFYGLAGKTTFWSNKKLRKEREVNDSKEVQEKIKEYIDLLNQKCNNLKG